MAGYSKGKRATACQIENAEGGIALQCTTGEGIAILRHN